MKILTRYLFAELLVPFALCLVACISLWIVADLFGTLDEFLEHDSSIWFVVQFYIAQLPKLLLRVLPVTLLFSTLFVLLRLSRHRELVVMQSGGIHPLRLYLPFFVTSLAVSCILFWLGAGPAPRSEEVRRGILRQVKGLPAVEQTFNGVVFRDREAGRMWFVQQVDTTGNSATGFELLQQDGEGHDQVKYFARQATYQDGVWHLTGVRRSTFSAEGDIQREENLPTLDLPGLDTSPRDLTTVDKAPEQLDFGGLRSFLARAPGGDRHHLAPYRTQLHSIFSYPVISIVLLFYAIALGTPQARGSATAGVFNSIFVLIGFLFILEFFLAMGRGGRMSPFLAAWAAPFLFMVGGLILFYRQSGSSFRSFWKH